QLFLLMLRRPPIPTLFPYTTLFRSTHDLDQKVQIAAIETVGLLQNTSSVPELLDVLEHSKINKVKRAALTALAMLPDEQSRSVRSEEHTSELQSRGHLVCRLLLEKK